MLTDPVPKLYQTPRSRFVETFRPTIEYWFETEVHVYALSIAASVLLSFFPFLIVMVSLCKYLLRWPNAVSAINVALIDFFPGDLGEFIIRNLTYTVEKRGPFQIVSLLLLLFTANGIFVPLEVAFNRAWGVTKNRTYLMNQMVSLGLIFICGGLALLSFILTALHRESLPARVPLLFSLMAFKFAALPISILALGLMYWLLPNRKIPVARVIPVAILVGIVLEGFKYINLLTWPLVRDKLRLEYGPFHISVTIILWTFVAAMIILAGAEWSARRGR